MTRFLPQTPSLIVLNYHRIGNREPTPFDGQLFSATAEEFRRQVDYLKRPPRGRPPPRTTEDVFYERTRRRKVAELLDRLRKGRLERPKLLVEAPVRVVKPGT
jgi:hypothetical protein